MYKKEFNGFASEKQYLEAFNGFKNIQETLDCYDRDTIALYRYEGRLDFYLDYFRIIVLESGVEIEITEKDKNLVDSGIMLIASKIDELRARGIFDMYLEYSMV